jgi:hypothetical protein
MFLQLLTFSPVLLFATASISEEQRLNRDLTYAAKSHMRASSLEMKGSLSSSVTNLEESDSTHSIVLQEAATDFFIDAEYIDEACTAISTAEVFPLNSCTFSGVEYFLAVANSTTITKKTFSDAGCSKLVGAPKFLQLGACSGKEKHYLQSTSKVTSSQSIVTTR